MKITNIKDKWVSEVSDIDCANLTPLQKTEVYNLFAKQKVVIFKDQFLNNTQLKEFCSVFGQVWDNSKAWQTVAYTKFRNINYDFWEQWQTK